MKTPSPTITLLKKEKRSAYTRSIITHFDKEKYEKIGMIAAEDILEFFLQLIGPEIYNKGVDDSKKILEQRFQDLEVDLDLLKHV